MAFTKVSSAMADRSLATTIVATNSTLVADNHYFVSTAGVTVTLPASPTAGQHVSITVANFADTIVARNGENIMATAEDMTIDTANMGLQFVYSDATNGWRLL